VTDIDPEIQRARTEAMARIEHRILAEERARVQDAGADNAAEDQSLLTDEERASITERAHVDAQELMGLVGRYLRDVGGRTDEELIAETGRLPHVRNPLELTRRLISSNKELRSELVKSRESSERLTAALSEQITRLTDELKNFRKSSDKLSTGILTWSRILAALTGVLIVGTVILIAVTA